MVIHCKYDELSNPKNLKNHPRNRNKHGQDQIDRLAEMYKYHGIRHPIIISNLSKFIVAGHGRKLAAIKSGIKEFPVVYQDFDSADAEYAFIQADNAIALWADLDLAGIKSDLMDLGPDFDSKMLGIKDFTLDESTPEPGCDEDDVPDKVEPKSKLGDIYQMGNHRLMCGDSTSLQDVKFLMNGETVNLVLTDPPYNVAVNDEQEESLKARNRRKDGLKIANDKMSDDDFDQFLLAVFTNYFSVMKDGASIYVFYADSMTIPFISNFIKAGFHFAQNCIWAKQQFVMTRKDYHYKHEPVMYGWKKGAAHEWYTDRKQSSVWNFDRPFRNELHPTMKPIELIEYPLKNSSDNNGIVLDLFGGSGSTLIACEKTNRKCFMMELDPHYVDVIVARWEKYTGKKAELING